MRKFGERFEHNLHSLRIVESFENRYARFPGLNLTFEVREGIVKHSRDFVKGENPRLDEYSAGLRPPLEAQLIDLADEIAYNTADLDDAFAAKLFTIDEVRQAVPHFDEMHEQIEGQFPGAPERVRFLESLRGMIDWLASGLVQGTTEAAETADIHTWEQVPEHPRRLASFTAATQATNRQLKQFLHHAVYFSAPLVEERNVVAAMVGELFEHLMEHPEALPEDYRLDSAAQPLHRAVCDYIAGMTDGFFRRTYEQHFGQSGSTTMLDTSAERTP
jgi:dGTPase